MSFLRHYVTFTINTTSLNNLRNKFRPNVFVSSQVLLQDGMSQSHGIITQKWKQTAAMAEDFRRELCLHVFRFHNPLSHSRSGLLWALAFLGYFLPAFEPVSSLDIW
jgi:hypothetical protein